MYENQFSRFSDDQYDFLADVAWNENVHFFSENDQLRISLRPLERHKSYPNIVNTKLFMYFIYQGLADVGKLAINVDLNTHSFLFKAEYNNYALDDQYKKIYLTKL